MQTDTFSQRVSIPKFGDIDIGHCCLGKQVPIDSQGARVLEDLPFEELTQLAYMFNYQDNRAIGKRRVLIQLDDSDWSLPQSLESIGTPSFCSIEHAGRGLLEVGFKVKAGPGRLGKYTKIVRFMPRIVVTNKLDCPLRFHQPAGFMGETDAWQKSAMCVLPQHSAPIHLPIHLLRVRSRCSMTVAIIGLSSST